MKLLHQAAKIGYSALILGMGLFPCPLFAQDRSGSGTEPEANVGGKPPPSESGNFPVSNAVRVYYPEEFLQFAPRNALDLVEEIPGFSVEGGTFSDGGRGFGEASGNLLVNGDRISSKSTSTRDELSRIPVANVIRIEIVDGNTLDSPGLSGQVANVFVLETSSISGQYSWRPSYSTGPQGLDPWEGDVSIRGSTGSVTFSIAADIGGFGSGSVGTLVVTPANEQSQVFEYLNSRRSRRPSMSGIFSFDIAPDIRANMNLSGSLNRFRSHQTEISLARGDVPDTAERFRSRNNEYNYEIGGDIEFPLGPGRLKLIALESFVDSNFVTTSFLGLGAITVGGSQFARGSQTGERIARAE